MGFNRRRFLTGTLGAGVLLVGVGAWLRPQDRGAPYSEYFRQLNRELKAHGPMRPVMLIDLDRLDHNIDVVKASVQRAGKQLRLVEKSLPAPGLLNYIAQRAETWRLMSFHQPFLNHDAVQFPQADILLGKPLPVRSAELFYTQHKVLSTRRASCNGCSTRLSDWSNTGHWPKRWAFACGSTWSWTSACTGAGSLTRRAWTRCSD